MSDRVGPRNTETAILGGPVRRFAELEGKRIAAIARAHWIDDALVGQAASAGPTPMPPERRESMTMATATATATPPRTAKRGCDQRRGDRRVPRRRLPTR